MNTQTLSYLLFTIYFVLLTLAPMHASGDSLYETLCKEADKDAASCLQLLKSDPRIVSANNYLDLSKFILDNAIKKGTEADNYFSDAMKKQPSQALKDCSAMFYGATLLSLQRAMDELVKEPKGANYDARAAGDGPANCESAIDAEKINDPTMHDLNKEMLLLSKIADLATKHLILKTDSY